MASCFLGSSETIGRGRGITWFKALSGDGKVLPLVTESEGFCFDDRISGASGSSASSKNEALREDVEADVEGERERSGTPIFDMLILCPGGFFTKSMDSSDRGDELVGQALEVVCTDVFANDFDISVS